MLASIMGVVISMNAGAQPIVKWTDEHGHVHYSDHAPPGHTRVSDVGLPSTAQTGSITPTPTGDAAPASASNDDAAEAAAAAEREQKKRIQQQQEAQRAARKKSDQAVVDRCKADHNTFCNVGADELRKRERLAALMQCANPAACRNVEKLSEAAASQ
jgi:hypothetical protein